MDAHAASATAVEAVYAERAERVLALALSRGPTPTLKKQNTGLGAQAQ